MPAVATPVLAVPHHGRRTRRLLGIRTPIVGREVELATLSAALSASFSEDEPGARVALVIAPAGLRQVPPAPGLVRRALARKDAVAVLSTVGDPSASGCAYALLATVLRRQCGLDVSAPVNQQQQALVAYMARTHPQAQSELRQFWPSCARSHFCPRPLRLARRRPPRIRSPRPGTSSRMRRIRGCARHDSRPA